MPTNWADEVEQEVEAGTHDPNGPPTVPDEEFPTLAQAAKMPAKQAAKKGKGKRMALAEFVATPAAPQAASQGTFGRRDGPLNDREILMSLPTASRGKTDGDDRPGGLGGGFKEYGGERGGRRERDDRFGGRDRDGFGPPPSRADEADDWGSTRQFQPSGGGGFGERRGPSGGFRDRDGPPREPRAFGPADDADDWGKNKKYEPAQEERRGGFGGGFKDRDATRPSFRSDAEEQWGRGREFQSAEAGPRPGSGHRGFGGGFAEAPRAAADAEDRWGRRSTPVEATSTSATASPPAPAERPRLKLAPRTLPVESTTAVPTSSQADAATTTTSAVPKRTSNPFGEAKPREEVLKSKGLDPSQEPASIVAQAVQPELLVEASSTTQGDCVCVETKEEIALRESIAIMHEDLEAMEDPEDQDEVLQAIAQAEEKLQGLRLEREVMEAKAREQAAAGELEGGSWVAAKPNGRPRGPEAAPVGGATTANGGGEARSAATRVGRGPDVPAAGPRDTRAPPPRAVAAGAPNVERKW